MKLISVLIVDQSIENKGILSNAAFVIGLTAGREMPSETFGSEVIDKDGMAHKYLTNISHIVRKAGQSKIKAIREELTSLPNVKVVDYTEDASTPNYQEYMTRLGDHKKDEIKYRALHIFGPEEIIYPKTKNLSLLN